MTTYDATEHRLCGEFWVWLYAERKRRGTEPTDAEKRAHPSFVALAAHRATAASSRGVAA